MTHEDETLVQEPERTPAAYQRIAGDFECSPSTVLRTLRREGVAP